MSFVLEGDRKVPGHRNILAARSEYFAACFRSQMREGQLNANGTLEIEIEEISYEETAGRTYPPPCLGS